MLTDARPNCYMRVFQNCRRCRVGNIQVLPVPPKTWILATQRTLGSYFKHCAATIYASGVGRSIEDPSDLDKITDRRISVRVAVE